MKMIQKFPVLLIVLLIAVVSVTKLSVVASNPETHKEVITQIDKEIQTVLKLSAGSAGASAIISMLPDDQCTPIANQLAEFSKYFLIVLSALYLEKYLVSLLGYASFSFLLPLACILWGYGFLRNRGNAKILAYKFAICAMALYLMIPISAKVSQMIYTTYETSIEGTIAEADRISITQTDEDSSIIEKVTSWIQNAALTVTEYVTGLLSRFVDALAVMLVASCLIPLAVVLFCLWLIKLLFGVQIPIDQMRLLKLGRAEKAEGIEEIIEA